MFGLGFPELIVIFLVILLLFGGKALPDIAKGLGQAIRLFKKEVKGIKEGLEEETGAGDTAARDQQKKTPEKDDSHDFDPHAPRRDWRPGSEPPADKA